MDKTFKFKKYSISYDDVGEGKTIIFLHGWGNSKDTYDNLIELLSKKYRCISIDLPGFGKSDFIDKLTLPKISTIIDKVVNEIGINKFYIVGHSLGGAVSLVYASRFQEKIYKLVLISPFVSFKQFSRSLFYVIQHLIPFLINKILLFKKPNMKFVNAIRIIYLLSSTDLNKYLRKVRKDILIIFGTKDNVLSIKPLEPVFGLFTNIHLSIYQDVRHFMLSYNSIDLAKKIDLFFTSNHVK